MAETGPLYAFGRFSVDASQRLLYCGGQPVGITAKAFETLLVLVENSGRVVAKGELMTRVWHDTHVEENNLAQNISLLRKVLGNSEAGQPYIETIPKRGYRFSTAVEAAPGEDLVVRQQTRATIVIEDAELPQHAPEIHYARSGDVDIAYQVVGSGPLDLVFVMGWVSHLEYFWREPSFARFLRRLASFSRLIVFDKRGTGLSDRVPLDQLPTLEQRMDDVRAVLDAVGSRRAALLGVSEGGPLCSLFAATYPEKTSALVMIGSYAKRIWDPEYPWAPTVEQRTAFIESLRDQWGGPVGIAERAPSRANDPEFRDWWATYLRMGASPGAAVALTRMNSEIDIRPVLPTIRVPTLVLHRTGDRCLKVEEGRYVAANIPGARYVELPGDDHLPFVGDQDAMLDEIEEFLTGARHRFEPDTVLATVLDMRIVENGSQSPADVHQRIHGFMRREIEWFRGRELALGSTRLLATFDGPARAVRCASAVAEAAKRAGVDVAAGVHTGECDIVGEGLGGNAVDVGARFAEAARPGEILVSSTVKDLVAGSGLQFRDRGRERFGALGEWQVWALERT